MSRGFSISRFLCFLCLAIFLPLAALAQASDEESTVSVESAIDQAADETVEDATQAEASDPESESPFFEPAKQPGVAIEDLKQLLVPLTAAELASLAEVWQRNLQAALERGVTLNLSLQDASEQDADAIREQIVVATEQRSALQAKYNAVLDAWQRKGGSEDELKPHRAYLSALTTDVVRTTDWTTLIKIAAAWMLSLEGGLGWILVAVSVVAALFLMKFPAMLVRRLARRPLDRVPDLSRTLREFILAAVYWATFAVAITMVLAAFGVSIGPLLTIFGGLSFVLAFAMQDSLSNIASGLMIMILKPFDLGDFVDAAGVSGEVSKLNLVSTTIRTFDNQFIIVPNSKIWNEVITNVNVADTRRVDMVFGIGYGDDLDRAKEILMELCTSHELVLKEPEPVVVMAALADSSVNINCRPWTRTEDYWTVYWDILGGAKKRFDAEGISIPFPQRDVHIIHDGAPAQVQGPQEPAPELEHETEKAASGEEQPMTSPSN